MQNWCIFLTDRSNIYTNLRNWTTIVVSYITDYNKTNINSSISPFGTSYIKDPPLTILPSPAQLSSANVVMYKTEKTHCSQSNNSVTSGILAATHFTQGHVKLYNVKATGKQIHHPPQLPQPICVLPLHIRFSSSQQMNILLMDGYFL